MYDSPLGIRVGKEGGSFADVWHAFVNIEEFGKNVASEGI